VSPEYIAIPAARRWSRRCALDLPVKPSTCPRKSWENSKLFVLWTWTRCIA
jgi:hypothetical protein